MKETTGGFRGEYSFLSNFTSFETPLIVVRGDYTFKFTTSEHYYQACKFTDYEMIKTVADHPSKGLKKFINQNKDKWRSDWDDIKLGVMRQILRYKFSDKNPKLQKKLIATKGIMLIEYNYWNDTYWGVSIQKQEGLNNLGLILMEIREKLEGL